MFPAEFMAADAADIFKEFGASLESQDMRPVFESMVETVNEGIGMNFANASGPMGKWPPHAELTIKLYGPHPLLILTGAMRNSLINRNTEGRVEIFGDRTLEIGTDLFYAKVQQYGGGNIPARPYVWLAKVYIDELQEIFAKNVAELFLGGN